MVLAAGSSQRLHRVTGGGSKALIHLGGLTLVERAVRTLLAAGVQRVLVVVGYHAGTVAAVVNRIAPRQVRAIYAENWEEGNGASLSAVRHALAGEKLFALVTADHVFGEDAIQSLLHAGEPAVLVDPFASAEAWQEGTRVRISKHLARGFGKELDEPAIDCGAFLLSPEIFESQRLAALNGDASLAGALTRLVRTHPQRAIRIPEGSWWQDIDSPDDLRRARSQLKRSLVKSSDGPVSRFINRPISTRISMALAPLRLHPDLLSVIAFIVGLIAAGLLVQERAILGGILIQAASILDGVDGEVARLSIRSSPRGALLDGVLDRIADAAILAALGMWALTDVLDPGIVVSLTAAAVGASMLSMATKDRVAALGLPKVSERFLAYLLGGRDGRLLIAAVCAPAGRPLVGLAAIAVTGGVSVTLRVWLVRRHSN